MSANKASSSGHGGDRNNVPMKRLGGKIFVDTDSSDSDSDRGMFTYTPILADIMHVLAHLSEEGPTHA